MLFGIGHPTGTATLIISTRAVPFILKVVYLNNMRILTKIGSFISSVVSKLFSLLEFFLFLRLLLKFFWANPDTLVVKIIYKYSEILVSPFNSIFPNIYWRNYFIETSTIAAMIGYGIVVFVLFRLLRLFSQD